MKPAAIDLTDELEIYQGDYYSLQVYIFNEAGTDTIDLTDYVEPKSQIRATETAPQPLAEFECVIDPDQTTNRGLVTLTLLETDTEDMSATTSAVWDFEMINPDGHKETWVKGSVTVEAQVTYD